MNNTSKEQIRSLLITYCEGYDSMNKASHTMAGVSSATISQIVNENWESISNDMWRKVAYYVGWQDENWKGVETRNFRMFTHLLTDAKEDSITYAVIGNAGTGKTYTCKQFARNNKNAYHLVCSEFWNRKNFLTTLMTKMGRNYRGLTVSDMIDDVIRQLQKTEKPIIILDEADKLNDAVLYFFITLYNYLEDTCGIVLTATNHLQKKIEKGLRTNRKGYNEIYSRIGRKFIELAGVTGSDVHSICMVNGIEDKKTIQAIWDNSEEDLRRVKRRIHAEKKAIV